MERSTSKPLFKEYRLFIEAMLLLLLCNLIISSGGARHGPSLEDNLRNKHKKE